MAGLLSAVPHLEASRVQALDDLRDWLLARAWPKGASEVRSSLENLSHVLGDLLFVLRQRGEQRRKRWTYVIPQVWPPDNVLHKRLMRQFEYDVALLQDLALELTRAANYVCDCVREQLNDDWRRDEGVLVVTSGDYFTTALAFHVMYHRAEYQAHERTDRPYPGLQRFKQVRATRSDYFGKGARP
jgi:hypothetical protein